MLDAELARVEAWRARARVCGHPGCTEPTRRVAGGPDDPDGPEIWRKLCDRHMRAVVRGPRRIRCRGCGALFARRDHWLDDGGRRFPFCPACMSAVPVAVLYRATRAVGADDRDVPVRAAVTAAHVALWILEREVARRAEANRRG